MSEHARQPEQSGLSQERLFNQYLNWAFDAAAAIRTRLYAQLINHGPKTPQQVEDMARVADELQRIADSLGA